MKYHGSCHCGGVQFEVEGTPERVMACNCSICSRLGTLLWFVPRAQLTLLTAPGAVADYTFGPATVRHRFCPVCGVHPYGEGTGPDGTPMAAVNVRCLEGLEFDTLPVDHYDGRAL